MKRFISRLIFIFCLFLSVFSCVEPELIVGQGQNQNQTELSIGSDGGIFTIPISSNVDFTCSLSNDCKSWCSITQTKAMNDYSIILTVKENDTYDSRTGTLTISYAEKSTTLTITQSQKDELILTQKEFIVGTEGGELKIPVSTNIQYSCTVMEGAQGWITIKQAQTKGLEDYNIVLQIAKNESYDGRIGQVKISGAGKESFITITQKQVDALIVEQKEFSIGSDGGNITIPLRSNIDYSCSLSDDCKSWCSITQTKALNNYNIILSVAKNEKHDPRTGTLTISYDDKSIVISITQSQKDEFILTQKEFIIGSEGGELKIPVSANIQYSCAVVEGAQDWITIEQAQTKGLEDYNIVLKIAKNESYDGRVGQVKISGAGKESFITITQKQVDAFIIDQQDFAIGSDGGNITIPLRSNIDYSCSLSDDCKSWCSITQTKALNDYNIILSVAKNNGYDPRTGTLTISYGDKSTKVTITQSQKDEIILTQKEFTIGSDGGELRIPVLTNINYTATVLGNAQSWIEISQVQTKGLEQYHLVLQIAKNESYDGRVGQVKISGAGKESFITITQKQVVELIVDQQYFSIGSDGGTITIPVSSNVDYSCSLSDDCKSWCTITQTKALNNYNIILSVAKNEGYDPRTGTLTISYGDKSTKVTITQSQKDEIILTQKEFTIGSDGGELRIPVLTNINYTATVLGDAHSWIGISQVQTKGLEEYKLVLQIAKNSAMVGRVGQVKISGAGKESFININQGAKEESSALAKERAALTALYNSLNGSQWTRKDNWLSDKPLNEWYGIGVDAQGHVIVINLPDNNLSGNIPAEIGDFSKLRFLQLCYDAITGNIPPEICKLKALEHLYLFYNQLTGPLPGEMGTLTNLSGLDITMNNLSGTIPTSILNNTTFWEKFWSRIVCYNNFDLSGITNFPAPNFTFNDVSGAPINLGNEYSSNKYTILFDWQTWCSYCTAYTPQLISIYNTYKSKGLNVIGCSIYGGNYGAMGMTDAKLKQIADTLGMPWRTILIQPTADVYNSLLYQMSIPNLHVVDENGNVVFSTAAFGDNRNELENFIKNKLGEASGGGGSYYESTDYSADGKVKTLETHTVGNGIKLIFTGDAFTDKDHAAGTFDTWVQHAVEAFFSEEPYKSLRNRFDVYSVAAVSKNKEIADDSQTAFSCSFGEGTFVEGNDAKVFEYANKVPDADMSKSVVTVIINSPNYSGTCSMYSDNSAIGYCAIIDYSVSEFGKVVLHESGGHAFGKLLDEYTSSGKGAITEESRDSFIKQRDNWGWGANVDITSDPATIQWSFMLSDANYQKVVGIYEGALTFATGAWRPTTNSIMNANTDGFNAPSRFAIYKRIMQLSQGTTPTFAEFAVFDAPNLTKAPTKTTFTPIPKNFIPFHPPVIKDKKWNE